MTQVGEAWMPSLCSTPTGWKALRSPSEPSALTANLGVRNRLMPLGPAGASGRRASTKWTMLSVASWSPQVMKIFWPFRA
ncbi:hypothetical protein D3C75_1210480 [compost metagenome]